MAREVTIKISAQDNFSGVMQKYHQAMGQTEQDTRKVAESNRDSASTFSGLQTAIAGTIAAIGIQQVISFAEGFNQLGTEVHANRVLFNQLSEEIGGNVQVLESLRGATGGVVSDLDLMAGASQLLRLNIVDNNDDLATLTSQIQKLKQPTESTTDAIQNFALMLSNESLLRLDSFGISSANVKRRMDELGMSFREATMAEMANAVERLGDAGTIAETGLARLQTKLENFWNQGAENFAIGFNAAIEGGEAFINYINGTLPSQIAEQQANSRWVQAGTDAANEFFDGYTGRVGEDAERRMREFAERYAGILESTNGATLANKQQQLLDLAIQTMELPLTADNDLFRQMEFLATMVEGHKHMLDLQEREVDAWNAGTVAAEQLSGVFQQQFTNAQQAAETLRQSMILDPAAEAWQRLYGLSTDMNRGTSGGQILFTPQEAAEARDLLNQFNNFYDTAKESGILSDEQLDMLKEGASEVKDMADNIQRGADAFMSMNLSEIFGQSGGGAFGEMTDRMAAALEATGATAERIQQFTDAANLASGRETNLSQSIDPFLQSQVADLNVQEQIDVLRNLTTALAMARQRGIEAGATDLQHLSGMFANGSVNPNFDPTFALDAMAALERARANNFGMSDAATTDPQALVPDFSAAVDDSSRVADSMDAMSISSETFKSMMDEAGKSLIAMSERTYTLRFKPEGIPDWLEPLLRGGTNFFEAIETTVNNAGGNTPGEQRTQRGSRAVRTRD